MPERFSSLTFLPAIAAIITTITLAVGCRETAAPSTPVATPEGQTLTDVEQPPLPLPSETVSTSRPQTLYDGYFESNGCGHRKYRRTIKFQKEGRFSAGDTPHPCKGQCAVQWTVERYGSFSFEGENAIRLIVEGAVDPQEQIGDTTPFPSTFLVLDGALTEPGKVLCRYRHVK